MGIILGALAGAGDYIAKSETQNQKRMDDMDLEKHRSDLEMRKLKMLDSLRERSAIATEQRAEEPLKRFGTALAANQQGEVPVTAAPVSGATGQVAAGAEVASTGIIGQTRKITSDEALNKTLGETMASDPVALAAYEKNIGKSARDDRRIDVTQARDEARGIASAKESDRKALAAERSDATQRYLGELRAETSEKNAQARLEALVKNIGGGTGGTKEALAFLNETRKELANNAADLNKYYTADTKELGGTKLAAVKAEYKPKQEALDAKRKQVEADFVALREKIGLPPIKGSETAAEAKPVATRPAPAGNIDARKQGQIEILQQEWDKSTALLSKSGVDEREKTRLQDNLNSLTREFKNLGATPGSLTKSTAVPAPAAKTTSPYAEGTKLTGPGGKPYIVRNGKPEPV